MVIEVVIEEFKQREYPCVFIMYGFSYIVEKL